MVVQIPIPITYIILMTECYLYVAVTVEHLMSVEQVHAGYEINDVQN